MVTIVVDNYLVPIFAGFVFDKIRYGAAITRIDGLARFHGQHYRTDRHDD